jgi:hypothetical protein
LIDLFFGDHSNPHKGSRIATPRLQRLASLAIRYASFMPLLLPFSRSFTKCISPFNDFSTLSARVVVDWALWRLVLRHATYNVAWFEISYSTPLLFHSTRTESDVEMAIRQAADADAEIFVDACTSDKGIGVYAPAEFSIYLALTHWLYYLSYLGQFVPVNINVLEFLAAILGVIFYIFLNSARILAHPSPFHIHVWTDNTTAYWNIRKNRGTYPLSNMFLQMLALIQLRYHVLITIGHIPGEKNIYADAISRRFNVPTGAALRNFLKALPHYHIGPALTTCMALLAMLPSKHPSLSLHAVLIALELITGFVSVISSTSL